MAVVSPASVVGEERLRDGVAGLERCGYRVKVMSHALVRGPLNYAGTLEQRVADLHTAFADQEVDAIVCARGGWGCAELLPLLDKELIRANPKVVVGYSDVTSLHVWLWRELGLVTFQGPMVASDWSKAVRPDMGSWLNAVAVGEIRTHVSEARDGAPSWSVSDGLRVLKAGRAEGVLTGGCLSIYTEALGTPYAARAEGGILFLEDTGTKAYQWDRMLVHLRYAGMLQGVRGIVFGEMSANGGPEEQEAIEAAIRHALNDFAGPVGIGLRSGHVDGGNVTLAFGVKVRLELEGNPRMDFVEGAVEGRVGD